MVRYCERSVAAGKDICRRADLFQWYRANLEFGFPLSRLWNPIWKLIRFDAPGVGGSSTPSTPFRFPGLAKLAARIA